jgi:transcriptional regulator with XRE-family HTH domain
MIIFTPISTVLDAEGKKRLGDVVRLLRQEKTQKEFAKLLNVGQSTLSMWESGKVTPDLENLEKLAEVWGKTPEEFVAYLYGRKILNGTLVNEIDKMSFKELLELQMLISKQMSAKVGTDKSLIKTFENQIKTEQKKIEVKVTEKGNKYIYK